jgi:hypothetical protein
VSRERSELRARRNNSAGSLPAEGHPPPPSRRWVLDVLTPKTPRRAGGIPKAPAPAPPVCFPFASAFQRPLTAHAEAR